MADPQSYTITGLLDAIREVESNGRNDAVSSKGAVGTMQTMLKTLMKPGYGIQPISDLARDRFGFGTMGGEGEALALAKDPEVARRWAYDYLERAGRWMQDGDMDRLIGSYNAGIDGVQNSTLSKFPDETRDYVAKVRAAYEAMTGQPLPERGYTTEMPYGSIRPRPRPAGLLE
jgi:soluble lytic murein transglycosylase-like protein